MKQLTKILKFYKENALISKGIENLIVNFLTIVVNIYIYMCRMMLFYRNIEVSFSNI